MQHFDIAIIGGGIAGLSLAYFLGKERSVVLLEREEAFGYHATGRSAAEFVLGYNLPEVRGLARISKDFLDQPPAGFCEVALLEPLGCVIIAGEEKRDRFETVMSHEQSLNAGIRRLTREEALERAPILNPDFFVKAYHDPNFWNIEVESLVQGYLKGARRNGVEVRGKHAVQSARHEDGRWIISTPSGDISAGVAVNASGGWADETAVQFGVKPQGIVAHRRTAILVDLPVGLNARTLPEIGEIDDEFYMKPDGGRLFASPADATPCEPGDVQPEEIDIAWAAHHVEQATTIDVRHIAKSWAGMRSFAPDKLPVIGRAADNPAFFWLAGQGGYGILTSPALGALAASLLLGNPAPEGFAKAGLDPGRFRPDRF